MQTEVRQTSSVDTRSNHSLMLASWLITSRVPLYLLLGGVFLVGAWLRLTLLDRQSLWFDEADVVVRAQRDTLTVLKTFVQQGENGPLYNLMMHIWIKLFGSSETVVRLPSAIAGVLTLPVIFWVGLRTFGQRVALFATGLLAISPYHVWYSQEAKMYTIAVLMTLLSTAFLIEALQRNERRWWIGYVVITSLSFYFHVTTVLIFAAQSLFFVLTWRRWPGRGRPWLLSVAVLTLPYLPIAAWAGRVVLGAANTWQPKVTLWEMTGITATKFAVNRADLVTELRGTWLYATLALVGVVGGGLAGWAGKGRDSVRPARWVLLFGGLVAVSLIGFYLLTFRQPLFNDRYLIMALPSYLLLVALGLRVAERRAWPLAALLMVALVAYAWVPLRDINRSEVTQKEDWRPAYTLIAGQAEPDDLVLVHPGYLVTTFEYYAQHIEGLDQLAVTTIPSFRVEGFDAHQMAIFVRRDAPGERVWLVQSPDRVPGEDWDNHLESWLASGGEPLVHQVFNGVVVALYEFPPLENDPKP